MFWTFSILKNTLLIIDIIQSNLDNISNDISYSDIQFFSQFIKYTANHK